MNVQGNIERSSGAAPAGANTTSPRRGIQKVLRVLRRHRILSAIIALAVVGLTVYAVSRTEITVATPIIGTVQRGNIEDVVTAVGSLQPLNYVDVGAQVSGQLKKIYVQPGDEVKQGQLLAEIDATVQTARVASDRAQLQNLQAQLQDRKAQLELAQTQAMRQAGLLANMATSKDEYDSAQAALRSAQAQLKATQAQIDQAQSVLKGDEATLGYSKIYAPMSGTVSSVTAREGQTLNANQQAPTILQIADLSTMTVSTQVSEADVPKLHIGMDAYFTTLGQPNRRWTGKLRQILPTPTVVNNVVLYTALFDVANPDHQLMTQMTAQVFFVVASAHDVVTVPLGAVHFAAAGGAPGTVVGRNGRAPRTNGQGANRARQQPRGERAAGATRPRPATVTMVGPDGKMQPRDVVIGVTDHINAQVLSGLEIGDKIVVGTKTAASVQNNNNQRRGFGFRGFGGAP